MNLQGFMNAFYGNGAGGDAIISTPQPSFGGVRSYRSLVVEPGVTCTIASPLHALVLRVQTKITIGGTLDASGQVTPQNIGDLLMGATFAGGGGDGGGGGGSGIKGGSATARGVRATAVTVATADRAATAVAPSFSSLPRSTSSRRNCSRKRGSNPASTAATAIEAAASKPIPLDSPVPTVAVLNGMLARFAHTSQTILQILLEQEQRLDKAGL